MIRDGRDTQRTVEVEEMSCMIRTLGKVYRKEAFPPTMCGAK